MLPQPKESFESNSGMRNVVSILCASYLDFKLQMPEGTTCFGGAKPERTLLLGSMARVFAQ